MKFDDRGYLISETSDFPGSHGDSCANTMRFFYLITYLIDPSEVEMVAVPGPASFRARTALGFVRHPKVEHVWGPEDFSADQALPLKLLYPMTKVLDGLRIIGTKTIAPPGLIALEYRMTWLFALVMLCQSLLFHIPIRWDDGKRRLVHDPDHSADVLNYICGLRYLRLHGYWRTVALCRRIVDGLSPSLHYRVVKYFAPEPESELLNQIIEGYLWHIDFPLNP